MLRRVVSATTANQLSTIAAATTTAGTLVCCTKLSYNPIDSNCITSCAWTQQLNDSFVQSGKSITRGMNHNSNVGHEASCETSNGNEMQSECKRSMLVVQKQSKKVEEEDIVQQIRPILQASKRALRLINTVVMIVFEYKVDQYQHWIDSTIKSTGLEYFVATKGEDFVRQNFERDVENKLKDLQEAQRAYAEPDEDVIRSKEEIEEKRRAVHDAAKKLGEAEDQLSKLISNSSSGVHSRAAIRLRNLCRINGGTYIKVGQHLANLDHLLPPDYIRILQSLFRDCPVTPYSDVREVIREELGDYPENIFDEFEEVPIASASLAQVHVAREKGTGQKLAIKVQHRGLRETSNGDLLALEYVVRLVDRVFDEFKWGWIVDEIAPNLPKELDFKHEGNNAEKAAEHMKKTSLNCVVPKIHWNSTTSRVLCMDFEEGFSVTDLAQMEKSGLNKRNLAVLISSVFQAQIFDDGFIHCDPHPANVLWRKSNNGEPVLVLLDHGLYKQIDDSFRMNYAKLWNALLVANIDDIKKSCSTLGIDEMYPLLSAMLMSRPFDEVVERSKTNSFTAKIKIDAKSDAAMIRGYAQQYIGEIIKLLDKVPRQMLLLFKMNDCLRHIDHTLGSNANTLVIAGKYAVKAVYKSRCNQRTFINRLKDWFSYMFVMSRIRLFEAAEWWAYERRLLT
mmetsp:Transcript_2372/g.3389  ORF Transcript_2372/g.3389 Transcript_2372/m.3389 type:complete len:678 (-) Transcript_2372:1160-3193(-)